MCKPDLVRPVGHQRRRAGAGPRPAPAVLVQQRVACNRCAQTTVNDVPSLYRSCAYHAAEVDSALALRAPDRRESALGRRGLRAGRLARRDRDARSTALPRLANRVAEIDRVLTVLASTPRQIAGIARGHDERQLHRKPAPQAWSARDIVAHLRACAEVWGRGIERMIADDHPTIRYVSPRGWIKKTDYLEQDFKTSLRSFSASRTALLETLRALDATDWHRGATFSGTTMGRDASVLGYAKRIAEHEVGHLAQLRRTLG